MVVVKVQMSMFATERRDGVGLVYDEGRTLVTEQELPLFVLSAMRGAAKAFFWAERDGERWNLSDRAEWQTW